MSGPTTQSASNLVVPGAYVYNQPQQQAIAPNVNTALNGFVGGGNWGKPNVQLTASSPGSVFQAIGNDTTSAYSLANEMLNSMPEDGSLVGVRVTDGTDTAATINILDANNGVVITLTAVSTGSLPNGNAAIGLAPASARVDLVSSTTSGSNTLNPVYRLSDFFPNATPELFNNIIGYAALNGQYDAVTFKANVLAAVNGTAPGSSQSQFWIATAGSSTLPPATATLFNASGGTDGTTGLTVPDLIGTDGNTRTGLYVLRKSGAFQVCICGLNNLQYAQTLAAFAASENALGFITVPAGTTDDAAFNLRLQNNANSDNLVLVKDYITIYDSVQKTFRLVSPLGKAMGIVGLCPPEVSPINQPWGLTGNGAQNVISTEQSVQGPRSEDELAALITNGFVSITNQMPVGGNLFGFFDDVCSSGDPRFGNTGNYIPVVRMTNFLTKSFVNIGGPFVGKNQSIEQDDPLRNAVEGAFNNFLSQLKPQGGTQRIDSYNVTCDLTNNTPTTIAQGFLFVTVLVRYLSAARIFYVTLQGGTGVQVSQTPPPQLAA